MEGGAGSNGGDRSAGHWGWNSESAHLAGRV